MLTVEAHVSLPHLLVASVRVAHIHAIIIRIALVSRGLLGRMRCNWFVNHGRDKVGLYEVCRCLDLSCRL